MDFSHCMETGLVLIQVMRLTQQEAMGPGTCPCRAQCEHFYMVLYSPFGLCTNTDVKSS